MLNAITVERRAGLRRYRVRMLALCIIGFGGGLVACVVGLWQHEVLVAVVSLAGLPVGLRARVGYRGVRRALRLLGA